MVLVAGSTVPATSTCEPAYEAESIDRAREMWWLGLSEVEREKDEATGGNFSEDERYYRALTG